MGKVRSEPDVEKPKKRKEKKVSEDKVKKREMKDKKDRKALRAAAREIVAEDDESQDTDEASDEVGPLSRPTPQRWHTPSILLTRHSCIRKMTWIRTMRLP